MDLQERKLKLISYIAHLEDEHLLNEMELIYNLENVQDDHFKPFTKEELEARLKRSMDDFANGRFKTHEEVVELSKKW